MSSSSTSTKEQRASPALVSTVAGILAAASSGKSTVETMDKQHQNNEHRRKSKAQEQRLQQGDGANASPLPDPLGSGFSPEARDHEVEKGGFTATPQRRGTAPLGVVVVGTGKPGKAFAQPSFSINAAT
jgi:hypothetical protein